MSRASCAPEFDALDGFLSHAWAVTVTGAPKLWAIRLIEEEERSPRRWYGGAIGRMTFDGNMNTGLTLRTIRMKDGVAEIRAGATLLYDSDPEAEEAECRLKAAALFTAIRGARPSRRQAGGGARRRAARAGGKVLLIDHEDSFVHTLAGYIRTTGAECETMRHDFARARLREGLRPDLVVLSPGPGRPDDFAMRETLDLLLDAQHPGVRRVPRAARHRRVFRRLARRARHADARQAVAGARAWRPAARAACRSGSRSAAITRSTPCATLAAGAGGRRRDRGDGVIMAVEHKQPADRRGAVPSRNR